MIPSRKLSVGVEEREECSEKLVEPVTVEYGRSDLRGVRNERAGGAW